jgi:hypothetical protein
VVQGQADASTGVLTATSLRTYANSPVQVELRGTIADYVSASNFLVRGVPVDASAANVVFTGGTAASLRNGVFVDVVGQVAGGSGNLVTASSLAVLSHAPDGGTVDYQGTVSAVNLASGVFSLTAQDDGTTQTFQVTLAPNVVFSHGTAAQLVDGAKVEIEATNRPSGLLAYSVSFQKVKAISGSSDGSSGTVLETKGTLYNLTATSFEINALTIQINGVFPKDGKLVNGAKVDVSFIQSGSLNLAQEISLDD